MNRILKNILNTLIGLGITLGILLVIWVAFFFFVGKNTCSLVGCQSFINVAVPGFTQKEFSLTINGDVYDTCNINKSLIWKSGYYMGSDSELTNTTSYRFSSKVYAGITSFRNKSDLDIGIEPFIDNKLIQKLSLSIYGKDYCGGSETLIYEIKDSILNYTKSAPNGPKCGPVCYSTTIGVGDNGVPDYLN